MDKKRIFLMVLVGLSLVLGACRTAAPSTLEATEADPDAVFTAAAGTAGARMTEMAAVTPSPPPATETPAQAPPTDTVQATVEPTVAITTAITTTATAATGVGAGAVTTGDKAEFVLDVTVPDGTNFAPNETFIKTWRLQNAGTTTWDTTYSLVFVSGAQMNAPASVALPSQVAPGETVDISVNMTAPADPGSYRGFWNLRNPAGQFFGLGPNANEPIWVDIVVGEGGAATTPGASTGSTPVAALTPSTSGVVVTNATISVDNASVTGSCPHTFTFNTQFTTNRAATVTYRLDAGADNTGFQINVPAPATNVLDAGTHSLSYTLEFTNSVSGWARLHITAPVDVVSNQATFALVCQ